VDFWRLVWQERTHTIVMVTNLKEGNKIKCEQYWPDSATTEYGPFKVTLMKQQIFADYIMRTLRVTVSEGNYIQDELCHECISLGVTDGTEQ